MIGYLNKASNIAPKFNYMWMGSAALVNETTNKVAHALTGSLTYETSPTPQASYVGDTWVKRAAAGSYVGFFPQLINWQAGTIEMVHTTGAGGNDAIFQLNSTGFDGTFGTGRILEEVFYPATTVNMNVWNRAGTLVTPSFNITWPARAYSLLTWYRSGDYIRTVLKVYSIGVDDTLTLLGTAINTTIWPDLSQCVSTYSAMIFRNFNDFDNFEGSYNMIKISNQHYLNPTQKSKVPLGV